MEKISNINGMDIYRFNPIKITFVGARGTGKTSLMASMYHELKEKEVSSFSVTNETGRVLQETYGEMTKMIDDTLLNDIVENPGILGTSGSETYVFEGRESMDGKQFIFPFEFTDMPGGWYTDGPDHEEEVKNILLESSASFLVVDAPALFKGGSVHVNHNKTLIVENWYKSNMNLLAQRKHTVILVLSRCERFISDESMKNELFEKVRKEYGLLIRDLQNAGVQVVCSWVETLGGVQFFEYEKDDDGLKRAKFIRTGEYDPRNCAMPLILALRHGMKEIEGQLRVELDGIWQEIAGFIIRIFGVKTSKEMAHDCASRLLAILEEKVGSSESRSTFQIK